MEELLELIKTDFKKARKILLGTQKKDVEDYVNEYKGLRDIRETQVGKRENKTVGKEKKLVKVAKIPFSFQKKIVRYASAFLFGSPVELTAENENALNLVKQVWDDNRMDSILLKFCKMVKSETEATIFFFPVKNSDNKVQIKIRLYGSEQGSYSPFFDSFGDLKAFTWDFKKTNKEGKKIDHSWVFTAEQIFKHEKGSEGWSLSKIEGEQNPQPNLFKKIPVVYMNQEFPEWWEVKELIDRHEMNFSKFADTNDYFASPMVKLMGEVTSLPEKEAAGKAIKIPLEFKDGKQTRGGDVQYLTWEHAPEAIKLEQELSDNAIHSHTDTPDLSFNNVKGIGQVSGVALQFMFMGAIIKSLESQGDYSTVVQRVISLIKAGISFAHYKEKSNVEDLKVKVKFTSILPDNMVEIVNMLSEASGGKPILSQETAIELNPLVEDGVKEVTKVKAEQKLDNTLSLGETQIL